MRATIASGILLGVLAASHVAHAQEDDRARAKSPAMIATGISSMTLGSVAVGLGIPFIVLGARSSVVAGECPGCQASVVPPNMAYVAGGVLAVAAGVLAILGGIPLVYFGAKDAHAAAAWLTPGGFGGRF